ncbi:Kynurenine formamidase [Yersinia frederiksenii]|uniref:Kynurenine formamidase n=2 Tax=Yersinia frederiksenii TaxID=29484 RepID=A0A380PQ51_YERFR|nr:cyclase family protein [Yersinia frederiksenii]KGA44419.1 cyclase family protein [Yersinia frederiksenii ATCC 33641]SUP75736.1 Kynurenine formamidase [Yersinia frederiksenii]
MSNILARVILYTVVTVIFCQSAMAVTLPKPQKYVELNHPLETGMQTYPGLSDVEIYKTAPRYPNGALIDGIKFLGISATYIDSPYHADEKGMKISDYPLEKLVNLPIVVVKLPANSHVFDVSSFKNLDVKGKAVLLNTGKSKEFGTPEYSKNPPYMTTEAANWLVNNHASLVGIDALLVDNFNKNDTIPVHDILLKNGIVIAEDMTNIDAVAGKDAYLTAVPPRAPMASFPARIFAAIY